MTVHYNQPNHCILSVEMVNPFESRQAITHIKEHERQWLYKWLSSLPEPDNAPSPRVTELRKDILQIMSEPIKGKGG